MASGSSVDQQPGILPLSIKDKNQLYTAYMPFINNGGLFIPTEKVFRLGDEVFVLLTLFEDDARMPVTGHVIWITPQRAQGKRARGVGVQISEKDGGATQRKIEARLAGGLDGNRPTHTM